jgi:cell wall-associated protease
MKKTFKTILLTAFIFVLSTHAKAQLAGTHWQATINIPMPVKAMFDFKADTLFLIQVNFPDSGMLHETMKYKFENDTLSLQKISGDSPCDNSSVGKYKVEFKDEKMFLILIEDACDGRANAWPSDDPWVKVK